MDGREPLYPRNCRYQERVPRGGSFVAGLIIAAIVFAVLVGW